MSQREVMRQALAALELAIQLDHLDLHEYTRRAVKALRAELTKPTKSIKFGGTDLAILEAKRSKQKQGLPDVDALSNHIRTIDGNNSMGAGKLAESIVNWLGEEDEKK